MSPGPTVERRFQVVSELGLHARPAGLLVQAASRFSAELEVRREDGDEWVDGRSILSLLSLAAAEGTWLHARALGEDAEALLEEVGAILETPTLPQVPAA